VADAAGSRVDQNTLSGVEVAFLVERVVRGLSCHRSARGLEMRERLRLGHEFVARHRGVLGERPASTREACHSTDRVAGVEPAHVGPDRLDDAGHVPAGRPRELAVEQV
jgi:hypothetical protein